MMEKELLVEQVNLYVDDCGTAKLKCNTDCPVSLQSGIVEAYLCFYT